jgi:hypothetical protein
MSSLAPELDMTSRSPLKLALVLTAVLASALAAQSTSLLPLKYVGPATVPGITAGDLMTRLYRYADDSMMGRAVGTPYNVKATTYIESEVRRLGLVPAGDAGGYFQDIGTIHRAMDLASTMSVDGEALKPGVDFLANTYGPIRRIERAPVLVWYVFDSATAPTGAQLTGKIVALRQMPAPTPAALQAWRRSALYDTYLSIVNGSSGAVGIIGVAGDSIPAARVRQVTDPKGPGANMPSNAPMTIVVTNAVMNTLLGEPHASTPSGTIGKTISAELRVVDDVRAARNVVAILPGTDATLAKEYVAIGAHNDHVGYLLAPRGVHDSLRVVNAHVRPAGSEGGRDLDANPVSPDEWTRINADIAELRKTYPERPDSIFNGADDDGSGTVSMLEIAEAFARGGVRPKRSVLFVWHTGEEAGMFGSGYFMDHPTVPRGSIVAQLNIDMVGRGAATDVTGQGKAPEGQTSGTALHGGDRYLQLVGSRRLSTELGDLVEKVNADTKRGFAFDYNIDADGHQQNRYCRSDQWSYAKWGVPVVFFTTGGHADYHQVTDEPQYIRYDHMAAVDSLVFDVVVAIANLDHRVVVDKPRPGPVPAVRCKQ